MSERIELEGKRRRFSPPRFALLALVLAATAWAFDRHFESVAERMAARADIVDETGVIGPDRLALLREASAAMNRAYGISLRVHVRPGPVAPPSPADPKILFIGLDTAATKAVVALPPLVARALPPDLAERLTGDFFDPYFAAGAWPEGLYSCVLTIMEALDARR